MKQLSRAFWTIVLLGLLGLMGWNALASHGVQAQRATQPTSAATSAATPHLDQNISFSSQPHLGPAFINKVLVAYHSPAAGLGQQIYNLGRQYEVNTDLVLGIFGKESLFGTTGEATSTRSPGNLRCIDPSYKQYQPTCADTYAWFSSWANGFGAMIRLIKIGYVEGVVTGSPCPTLALAIPHWAPVADGGNPPIYISNVLTFLRAWYAGRSKP
jgi:hypothetical protein